LSREISAWVSADISHWKFQTGSDRDPAMAGFRKLNKLLPYISTKALLAPGSALLTQLCLAEIHILSRLADV
jgi:hypothetical protein